MMLALLIAGVLLAAGVIFACGLFVAMPDHQRGPTLRYLLRDFVPVFLFWLGLRLMSREARRDEVYSIQQRHTIRGIPDLYDGLR